MPDTTPLLERALAAANDTRFLEIGEGAFRAVPAVYRKAFGSQPAIVIGDPNTMRVAGREVVEAMRSAGVPMRDPFVFDDPTLYAEFKFVEQLDAALKGHDAIPIAVGAGSINDLVKLSAHRAGRQYLSVATAASMDGYTAFGSSVTYKGSKQTFDCPAPRAVVADLAVIREAPRPMTASGYADLVAKITAGADWIVADALQVEPIDPTAWSLVQDHLRQWASETGPTRGLVEGLMMTGFAMQWSKTSRPASGAEHQFSHLWDMEHHTHHGQAPSHGFKVGVGTLAVTRLYERLFDQDLTAIDIEHLLALWPTREGMIQMARNAFDIAELADKAELESNAKYVSHDELRAHLDLLKTRWPALRERVRAQLISSDRLVALMRQAGAPVEPEEIGITRTRLARSFRKAFFIRRRYTVLDLAMRVGLLPEAS